MNKQNIPTALALLYCAAFAYALFFTNISLLVLLTQVLGIVIIIFFIVLAYSALFE